MKRLQSGETKSVFRKNGFLNSEKKIISGSMEPVHVVHVLKYITTAGKNMVVESLVVRLAVTVTATWKYGTMYLPSLTETAMEIM